MICHQFRIQSNRRFVIGCCSQNNQFTITINRHSQRQTKSVSTFMFINRHKRTQPLISKSTLDQNISLKKVKSEDNSEQVEAISPTFEENGNHSSSLTKHDQSVSLKPQRPTPVWELFYSDFKQKLDTPEIRKSASEKWKKLTEQEKQVYYEQFRIESTKYKELLKEWEEGQRSQGEIVVQKETNEESSRTITQKEANQESRRSPSPSPMEKEKETLFRESSEKVKAKPVKTMTAYRYFTKVFFRKVNEQLEKGGEKQSPAETMKQCSQAWKQLTPLEKQAYVELMENDKTIPLKESKEKSKTPYQKFIKLYFKTTYDKLKPGEAKPAPAEIMTQSSKAWKSLTPLEKKEYSVGKDSTKPKRPSGTWILFYDEFKQRKENADLSGMQRKKLASETWKKLDDVEQQVYKDMFQVEFSKYKEQLRVWEESNNDGHATK